MLKHFKVNTKRDSLAAEFKCYQMDLRGPINAAIAAGEVGGEFKLLPAWAKFAANPARGKGFFTRMLAAMFLGQGGHDELNVDEQISSSDPMIDYDNNQRVAMMFITANNIQLSTIGKYAAEVLPAYEIVVLSGHEKYQKQKIYNRNAEQFVREAVSKGKNTLIIASQMAQRSFSIPEITELYLAYDGGQVGTTIQKMSRTLTPANVGKIGRIFSLSFDPNRDDKFDAMIVETAINYKKRHKSKSLREAMQSVLRTIDIFDCQQNGAVKLDIDSYLAAALARKGISRVLGKIVNLSLLDDATVKALATGNTEYFRNEKQAKSKKGKTREAVKQAKKNNKQDSTVKELSDARKTIINIVENLDVIMLSGEEDHLLDALLGLNNAADRTWVEAEFGVDLDVIMYLFDEAVISQDWVELMVENG